MRKYGKLLLVLGILAANPAWVSAEGFLGDLRPGVSGSSRKQVNQQKAQEVAQALQAARISGEDLGVEVRGDTARIVGKVRSVAQRNRADEAARRVPGINRVVNELTYSPAQDSRQAASGVQTASYSESAQSSNSGVRQVRFRKPGRRSSKKSTSRNYSRQQQQARPDYATQVAAPAPAAVPSPPPVPPSRTEQPPALEYEHAAAPAPASAPVRKVAAMKRPGPSNQQVAQGIANSLAEVGLVGYDVEIRYEDGTATLSGDVSTVDQLRAAGNAASRVKGVNNVDNRLQVQGPVARTAFAPNRPAGNPVTPASMTMPAAMMGAGAMQPAPTAIASAGNYSNPNLPSHAWPAYAQYPNSAAIQYPKQYSPSAFPYIGPFYPYPQVPLGWREVSLQWDDGHWQLDFEKKHDAWYWLWNPKNW